MPAGVGECREDFQSDCTAWLPTTARNGPKLVSGAQAVEDGFRRRLNRCSRRGVQSPLGQAVGNRGDQLIRAASANTLWNSFIMYLADEFRHPFRPEGGHRSPAAVASFQGGGGASRAPCRPQHAVDILAVKPDSEDLVSNLVPDPGFKVPHLPVLCQRLVALCPPEGCRDRAVGMPLSVVYDHQRGVGSDQSGVGPRGQGDMRSRRKRRLANAFDRLRRAQPVLGAEGFSPVASVLCHRES